MDHKIKGGERIKKNREHHEGILLFGMIFAILLVGSSVLIGLTETDPTTVPEDPYTPPPAQQHNDSEPTKETVDLSSSAPITVDTGG